jgi:cyanate permease
MSLLAFFEWLADTQWSVDLHESRYAYPIIESVHVWTMAVFFGLAVMFDLRLLGWTFRDVPISQFKRRVLPWTIAAFVIMVISGTLLFFAIPLRSYQNLFFRLKLVLLVLAGLNVWFFHTRVYPRVIAGHDDSVTKGARIAGALSLALWIGVVFSGRMIAYNWFDCDRQPQPDVINFLTSCTPTAAEH